VRPLLEDAGLWRESFAAGEHGWLVRVLELLRPRARKLTQIVDDSRPFLADAVGYDDAAVAKHLRAPGTRGHLEALRDAFGTAQPFDAPTLEPTLRAVAEARGVKAATLIHATRVAVTGRAASPGLFEVLELIGRDRVLERIAAGAAMAPD
jgi:glutamyl-tRNA synthetase